MSTLQAGNVWFESTGNNLITYNNNTANLDIKVGGSVINLQNSTAKSAGKYDFKAYTANATWTKPADLKYIVVVIAGAGGGGAGVNSPFQTGGDGGNGSIGLAVIPAPSIPGPQTITIGTGGAGGPAPATNPSYTAGSNGTNSSFGSLVIAAGGTGSPGPAAGINGTTSNASLDYTTGGITSAGFYPPGAGVRGAGAPSSPGSGSSGANGIVIVEEFY